MVVIPKLPDPKKKKKKECLELEPPINVTSMVQSGQLKFAFAFKPLELGVLFKSFLFQNFLAPASVNFPLKFPNFLI
jgi:hypothetical protein